MLRRLPTVLQSQNQKLKGRKLIWNQNVPSMTYRTLCSNSVDTNNRSRKQGLVLLSKLLNLEPCEFLNKREYNQDSNQWRHGIMELFMVNWIPLSPSGGKPPLRFTGRDGVNPQLGDTDSFRAAVEVEEKPCGHHRFDSADAVISVVF
ncbi:uncharacterized protein LOC131609330 isoform X2 [Vicia villosa]|uniref:uncharacterized protein LOC131609330 isoform X2 n=1 Tax=Vicia villosa TaxID=3911 RepID=UPI00273C6452|nr:uncharacterized protein LOC131609330 isoform X2 [Vicia villosa]